MSADIEPEASPSTGDTSLQHLGAEGLLNLATTEPVRAESIARDVLAARTTPELTSVAHQVLAIIERDRGRVAVALAESGLALRSARRVGPERVGLVRATRATVLLFAGRTASALAELRLAQGVTPGPGLPRVLGLTAATLWLLGRYEEALETATRATRLSRRHGDGLWEGRAESMRGDVLLALGHTDEAEQAYLRAEAVLTATGEQVEALLAHRSLAQVHSARGDVVAALRLIEETRESTLARAVDPREQTLDHVATLLTARLVTEARQMTRSFLDRADLPPVWRSDLLMLAARAALLAGDPVRAEADATAAASLFRAHRRSRWATRAALLAAQASATPGEDGGARPAGPTPARLRAMVTTLRDLQDPALTDALLLLAGVARGHHDRGTSRQALSEAARARNQGPPLSRAAGWLASALLAEQEGDRRGLRHACRRGLDAVDEHRSVMGDLELRALAGDHGLELARLAVRDAARSGSPRDLVNWAERWRATALTTGSALPSDPALAAEVAALRDVTRRLEAADEPGPGLARERVRLETAVRRRQRHLRGTVDVAPADATAALAGLGDTTALYLVQVDDELQLLLARGGRVTRRVVGPVAHAVDEASYATFALRRAAYGRPLDLNATGRRLESALLGELAPLEGPVLVVPPAALLSAPWGLLPALAGSVLTVAPSLSAWHRAHEAQPPDGPVVLVTGPGLTTEQEEASMVGGRHTGVVTLGGGDATVERALTALDGARLGHVAAHGHLRTDAPLFSAIDLADGPLMVHDLQRLVRPPGAVVLSACESAGMIAVTSDEALGLVSALLGMGTRSVVASVAAVNDRATVSVMSHVHAVAAAGGSLAEGLRDARTDDAASRVVRATAAAFTAFGA